MIKIKANNVDNPNFIALDPAIPRESMRLYIILYEYRDREIDSFYDTLSEALGISRSTLHRALKSLRIHGYIKEERDAHGKTIVLLQGRRKGDGSFPEADRTGRRPAARNRFRTC